jgi:hypothetical protein
VTFVWFIVWLITNNLGGNSPLQLDPVNFWTATLILAVAIDLNRPRGYWGPKRGWGPGKARNWGPKGA